MKCSFSKIKNRDGDGATIVDHEVSKDDHFGI